MLRGVGALVLFGLLLCLPLAVQASHHAHYDAVSTSVRDGGVAF